MIRGATANVFRPGICTSNAGIFNIHHGLLAVFTKLINWTLSTVYRYDLSKGGSWCVLINGVGDTKAGTLIATDRYGNKYFENLAEELPCKLPAVHLSTIFTLTDQ